VQDTWKTALFVKGYITVSNPAIQKLVLTTCRVIDETRTMVDVAGPGGEFAKLYDCP